jgi:hypothetical protein
VTGNGGVYASTTLTSGASIGDTSITVDNTTGISAGLVFDRGDGQAISVTDVTGNVVSLGGALTSDIVGSTASYNGLSQTSTSGSGTGAVFNVSRSGNTYLTAVANPGNGYQTGNTVVIAGTNLGGAAPTNSATILIDAASPSNTVTSLDNTTLNSGDGYTTSSNVATSGGSGTGLTFDITAPSGPIEAIIINSPGTGYAIGETISITQTSGRTLAISGVQSAGSGYVDGNDVATTGGTGTGLKVNVAAENQLGTATMIVLSSGGTGYTDGLKTTTAVTGTGTGLTVICLTQGTGTVQSTLLSNGGTGYVAGNTVNIDTGTVAAVITISQVTNGKVTNIAVNFASRGVGYSNGDTITITGGGNNATFTITSVSAVASIDVLTVNTGGVIQSVSTTGTPIAAPASNFISAITLNALTTSLIASGNTSIGYGAISTIEVNFSTAHGFVPGDTITVFISSSGTNAQLAAGAYFVEQVPSTTSLRYTARTIGTIANTLVGSIYARPDSFFLHRPFDGGVQLGTGGSAHGAQAIRMSKKYIRYQSGKGVMYNTGALFAPSYDLRSLVATGTAIGSVITINTDDTDHGCQVGAQVTISGVITSGYNGVYTVSSIADERTFNVIAYQPLSATSAVLDSPCVMTVRQWHGATVRAGIFDDQNGMFYQYDGRMLAVVRRSSTFQIAGVIAIPANSNAMTGTNTRFTQQLAAGDRIVVRGMSHVVTQIISDTSLTVAPDFRGVTDVSNVKICKTVDLIVPQAAWNNDPCNGSGPSGYNIDIGKMQMIGIQHTWYGAGFIDFMLRGADGNYVFVHRFRNSNVNTEAYMRTGNQPVRYEVVNEGAKSKLTAAINDTQTVIPLVDTYYFPNSGTVIINAEMIRYTGNIGTALTGCTRAADLTQFVAGSQRTFSGGAATSHPAGTGVILISNTITPIISHWGSAFMIDGQFDSDRGYIFNYAATGVTASVEKNTAFLIRLAPSVSNSQIGDLGERELLNRAQLLLSSIAITSDGSTGGVSPETIIGGIVVEGILNPINYPTDPTLITWTGLSSQAAGGQPSFAQIAPGGSVTWGGNSTTTTATIQGAFTTTITAKSFAPVTTTIAAVSFAAVTRTANAPALSSAQNVTYQFAFQTTRTDFLIPQATLAGFTTALAVNDVISVATYITSGQRISSITQNFITIGVTAYARIIMTGTANANSPTNTAINNITFTSSVAATYNTALSSSRNDFLITQTQFSSTTALTTDVLAASTYLTGNQTISSFTANYTTIAGVAYARVIMSSTATATSIAGAGNNITVTVTSSATARYGSALSSARTDFLITNAQAASSGIAVSDPLSVATFLTGGQTISSITTSYITISSVTYTRIIMSAAANSTSTSGAGQDQTVTVTAAGSAATYNETSYLFFTSTSWLASNAVVGTRVASDQTQFPAGTSVNGITTRTFGAVTVYRVNFTQSSNATINAAATLKFAFGAQWALPGEQVFSFIANPGETNQLSLESLKELTSTAIGGRGTFPNGPDVLAINVYKVSGTATPTNVILRWGEAQA